MKLGIVQQELEKSKLGGILVLNAGAIDPNLFYLTGFEVERGCLLITPKKATLFVGKLELWRAREESRIDDVREMPKLDELARHVQGRVGLNLDVVSASVAAKLKKSTMKLADASKMFASLREVKTDEEIGRMRRACAISDDIIEECIAEFGTFKTEGDAKRYLHKAAIDRGCDLSFPTIVGSGRNAALPHYSGAEKLRTGFCVIDFGVKYKGYCSDTTRTIYYGSPTQKEKLLYETLLKCQTATLSRVQPKTTMEELERFCRKYLGPLEKKFIHRLGHSVGIEVHDPLEKTTALRESMVVTVEPGIYMKGSYGMRIEDTVLVTKTGCKQLTKVSKELVLVRGA